MISNILGRLESDTQILMYHQTGQAEVTVDLPCMALHFTVQHDKITIKEYEEMKIATYQNFDAFIGLQNGLLLETSEKSFSSRIVERILLIPHGKVEIHHIGHQKTVSISTQRLNFPEFFTYEIDELLGRIKCRDHLSLLYLAYLHAVTASPLPDPLIGMIGTEAAFEILQSALAWSGEPLDKEAVHILKEIAQLSPQRSLFPPHGKTFRAEVTKYKPGMTPATAHDGFQFIVQKLLSDSERLTSLFPAKEASNFKLFNNVQLALKGIGRRSLYSNQQDRIKPSFQPGFQRTAALNMISSYSLFKETNIPEQKKICLRKISELCSTWTTEPNTNPNLTDLYREGNRTGITETECVLDINSCINEVKAISKVFPDYFLQLYNLARVIMYKGLMTDWTVFLGLLTFYNIDYKHLLFLHTVAVNATKFHNPPPYKSYVAVNEYQFYQSVIKAIFVKNSKGSAAYKSSQSGTRASYTSEYAFRVAIENQFATLVSDEANRICSSLESSWPIKTFSPQQFHSEYICLLRSASEVNGFLARWYENMELRNFLREITEIAAKLVSGPNINVTPFKVLDIPIPNYVLPNAFQVPTLVENVESSITNKDPMFSLSGANINRGETILLQKTSTRADSKTEMPLAFSSPKTKSVQEIHEYYKNELERSWDHYMMDELQNSTNVISESTEKSDVNYYKAKVKKQLDQIYKLATRTSKFLDPELCFNSGLVSRLSPQIILKELLCNPAAEKSRPLLTALGIEITKEQRSHRILKYEINPERNVKILKAEIKNVGHTNWNALEHPEWLLLEIEMNVMIRPTQIEVANRMAEPKHSKSSLMQLNMGEGKTTVILPLLISCLSNGKQLCRVTVLRSLLQLNKNLLRATLGNLLNQRLYSFPCRRDMGIGLNEVGIMHRVYEECMESKGFVLTVPEYRLSFQLKGIEKAKAQKHHEAQAFIELQDWLRKNSRDVLDECDELLREKYQLIYTVGSQLPINGGSLRWEIVQKVLKLVPRHLTALIDQHGPEIGECDFDEERRDRFPRCRIFKQDLYIELCKLMVEDIISSEADISFPELHSQDIVTIKSFLTTPKQEKNVYDRAMEIFQNMTRVHLDTLLMLRGILGCEILLLALTKRWRVNYGINPKPMYNRLMAVPFRAKDIAAERTEFGHPDVAIVLTQLSYYYQGLSDDQLRNTFSLLNKKQDAADEYNNWVKLLRDPHPSISKLENVNLKDYKQTTEILFPQLRKNMKVIDFWLNNAVFPRESKVFPEKLLCSPWDLCDSTHPVTGFSGTNDTKLLLPLNISQQDLPQLDGTNGKVLRNILSPENNQYESLPTGCSSHEILDRIVANDIRVLLDVGALMLELSNRDLAKEWLKKSPPKIEAGVFFDSNDELIVIDRKDRESKLSVSSFSSRLKVCVVYLDDVHTRGTDLKFPKESKAALTLGKGLTKDKLVQGAMRMRMLGDGHSVSFFSSNEVHSEMLSLNGDRSEIRPKHVLNWSLQNTVTATKEGFIHWVNAGVNFYAKSTARAIFDKSRKSKDDYVKYRTRCADKEVTQLDKMYGVFRTEENVIAIAAARQDLKRDAFNISPEEKLLITNEVGPNFIIIVGTTDCIISHCSKHVPNVMRLSHLLDEEQERELENELEEERQIERPQPATPATPNLHPDIVVFVKTGNISPAISSGACFELYLAFAGTRVWNYAKQLKNGWGNDVYVTKDFVDVVKNNTNSLDEYIKTVTWIACTNSAKLIMSAYEVNQLIPIWRWNTKYTNLLMFSARLHPTGDTLIRKPGVWIPSKSQSGMSTHTNLDSVLFLFSGSLYFRTKEEQDEIAKFLGIILRPRKGNEVEAFDKGWIDAGFLKPEHRETFGMEKCGFTHNPIDFIKGIIENRNEVFPASAHMAKFLKDLTKTPKLI